MPIDIYIATHDINAPEPLRYTPGWAPDVDPPTLHLAAANITSIICCTGFRMDFGFVDVRSSAGAAIRAMIAASRPGRGSISSACLGCTPGVRFAGVARDAAHIVGRVAAPHAKPARMAALA